MVVPAGIYWDDAKDPMRFVLATLGTLGDLYPFLALGRALTARGHSVVIAAARALHEHVEQTGDAQLKAFDCRPNMSSEDVRAGFADFDHWPNEDRNTRVAQVDMSEFIRDRVTDLLDACRGADALIHNSGVTGESVACEILGIADIRVAIAPERQWNSSYRAFLKELETVPENSGGTQARRFFEWNQQCRKRAGLGRSPAKRLARLFHRSSAGGRKPAFSGADRHLILGCRDLRFLVSLNRRAGAPGSPTLHSARSWSAGPWFYRSAASRSPSPDAWSNCTSQPPGASGVPSSCRQVGPGCRDRMEAMLCSAAFFLLTGPSPKQPV